MRRWSNIYLSCWHTVLRRQFAFALREPPAHTRGSRTAPLRRWSNIHVRWGNTVLRGQFAAALPGFSRMRSWKRCPLYPRAVSSDSSRVVRRVMWHAAWLLLNSLLPVLTWALRDFGLSAPPIDATLIGAVCSVQSNPRHGCLFAMQRPHQHRTRGVAAASPMIRRRSADDLNMSPLSICPLRHQVRARCLGPSYFFSMGGRLQRLCGGKFSHPRRTTCGSGRKLCVSCRASTYQ